MSERVTGKKNLSAVKIIGIFYVGTILLGAILLWLPIFHKSGVSISLVDALFTSASAVSVTGLTVVNTADTFNVAGKIVLLIFIQFGGIGIMTLGTFIWVVMGRKIGLKDRQLIMIDQNRSDFSGLVVLMKKVLAMAFALEVLGGLILGTYFLKYYPNWYEAYFYGAFHSISGFTNAGFDIFGNDSLVRYAGDYFVQSITMILLIFGSIGFTVLLEVRNYISMRHNKKNFRFSLYTKLTTVTFFTLLLIGAVLILLFENNAAFAGMSWHEKLFYSLFNSVTARNGGFSTIDISIFNTHTLFLISILMVIGASPSSCGGGIRTTTFAVLVLAMISFARGKKEVIVFNRRLDDGDILKSFVVFSTAAILLGTSIILLGIFEGDRFSLMQIIFEVSSAFGTTGLSMGITADLSDPSKILVTILMFIGRIGILSLLFLFREDRRAVKIHYPTEKIIIG
ncbi:MAG: TrkH family potassium uptake protein [Vulcanibacillus sp.]